MVQLIAEDEKCSLEEAKKILGFITMKYDDDDENYLEDLLDTYESCDEETLKKFF